MKEEEEEDGRGKMKSSVEGWVWGDSLTKAAFIQPITVKENISWCISSLHKKKKEWKARRVKCIWEAVEINTSLSPQQ